MTDDIINITEEIINENGYHIPVEDTTFYSYLQVSDEDKNTVDAIVGFLNTMYDWDTADYMYISGFGINVLQHTYNIWHLRKHSPVTPE